MFGSLDELVAHLRACAPPGAGAGESSWPPVLDPDGRLVDELVELGRAKAMIEAREMVLMCGLADWAQSWVDPAEQDIDEPPEAQTLAAAEVAPALHLTPATAGIRVERALRVRDRLPATLRALAAGDLDLGRLLAIDDATRALSDEHARAVEDLVLPAAVDQTAAELRAALRRAVIAVDPKGAEDRRKVAVKGRRVVRYQRDDGMGAIEAVLSAIDSGEIYDLIDELARRMKTEGDTRSIDARRADAYVWLTLGRDPQLGPQDPDPDPPPPTEPGTDSGPDDDDGPDDDGPDDDGPSDSGPSDDQRPVEPDDLDERYPPETFDDLASEDAGCTEQFAEDGALVGLDVLPDDDLDDAGADADADADADAAELSAWPDAAETARRTAGLIWLEHAREDAIARAVQRAERISDLASSPCPR